MRGSPRTLALAGAVAVVAGCSDGYEPSYTTTTSALQAYCTVPVIGKGDKAIETDYLPRVIRCENGSAPLEALKAQAVAARSYLYHKLNTSGSVLDSQGDQVYTCGPQPTAIHYQAVEATAGQVLRYNGTQVAAFFVAGAKPTAADCVAQPGDNDWSDTEKYVTYNWGQSGGGVTQTPLGWVSPSNHANRGCKSQNGASCLANSGWGYRDILKFYYGMDIELVTAEGACVGTSCECSGSESQSEPCGACGTRSRTCDGCSWGAWGSCNGQGACTPGEATTEACGSCGSRSRTCSDACSWGAWGSCNGQGPCAPGAEDTESCGSCGTRSRTCEAGCTWPAWGACEGEGECVAGSQEQEPCGDCGVRTRACAGSCSWGPWGACVGIEGAVAGACDTGAPGPCGPGSWECVDGLAVCQALVAPEPERCDGVDNDCNGAVDDGHAPLVDALPLAARLEAADVPSTLFAGQVATVRATFRNIGTEAWADGALWVTADGPGGGATSLLYADGWASGTLVGPAAGATAAGASLTVDILVRAPDRPGETVTETFRLADTASGLLTCETPALGVSIAVAAAPAVVEPEPGPGDLPIWQPDRAAPDAGGPGGAGSPTATADGCAGGRPGPAAAALAWMLLTLMTRRRWRWRWR